MGQPDGLAPRGPRARWILGAFLARSGTVLVGRIDGRGAVLAANRLLQRWTSAAGGTAPSLAEALDGPSRLCWEQWLAAGGGRGCLRLASGPGTTGGTTFRCRLVPDEAGTYWFCGEPRNNRSAIALRAQLHRTRQHARRLERSDLLTGLANRRHGLRRLAALVRRAVQQGTPLSCVMLDLDGFKAVNDHLGHPAGDRVLRAAARCLAQGLRGTDVVARYGGDEFLIVLPGTVQADALAIAERLRARLAGRLIPPLAAPLNASLGVAALDGAESARHLLARADSALLRAKKEGRARVVCAAPG